MGSRLNSNTTSSASLLGTSALLVVTMFASSNKCIATSNRCLTGSNKNAIRNKCRRTELGQGVMLFKTP